MSAHGGAGRPPPGGGQPAAQHGLAHPPTWAQHLGGAVIHVESQSQTGEAPAGAANSGPMHDPTMIEIESEGGDLASVSEPEKRE
eukprot:11183817-Lingulodinium_polyedra.AAC.1